MMTKSRRRLGTAVVIPAGGTGTRMGAGIPKQFLRLDRKSILEHAIALFESVPQVLEIVIVCPPGYVERVERLLARSDRRGIGHVVTGGRDRQESVWHGIQALISDAAIILVHDAVRPFAGRDLVVRVMNAAARYGAAVAAIPSRDTLLRQGGDGMITGIIERSTCVLAQTPQGFRRKLLLEAFRAARRSGFHGTDDTSLVLRLHHHVRLVLGSDENLKITTPHDLRIARGFVSQPGPRNRRR